jgi:hypothetical protein
MPYGLLAKQKVGSAIERVTPYKNLHSKPIGYAQLRGRRPPSSPAPWRTLRQPVTNTRIQVPSPEIWADLRWPHKRLRTRGARTRNFRATPTPISRPSSRPCANTGCRPGTPEPADNSPRGTSSRLPPARTCAPHLTPGEMRHQRQAAPVRERCAHSGGVSGAVTREIPSGSGFAKRPSAIFASDDTSRLHAWHLPSLTSNDQLMTRCIADRTSGGRGRASYR